jgi:predicted nucleotidyltransferase
MLTQRDIDKIKKLAVDQKKIVAVYIFGSVATEKDRKGSDVDLAVLVRGHMRGLERIEMETSLSNLLGKDVDLTVFGETTSLLQHQILKYGKLICEIDPEQRVEQEVAARSNYLDTKFLFKEIGEKANA